MSYGCVREKFIFENEYWVYQPSRLRENEAPSIERLLPHMVR